MESVASYLEAGAGVLLVLLVPGLPWAYALLGRRNVSIVERLAIGVGLSIALIPVGLFLLNILLGVPVGRWTVLILVLSVALAGTLAALRRTRSEARTVTATGPDVPDEGGSVAGGARWGGAVGLLLLGLIMGFAFYTSLIPRLDYSYPVHQDEWTHLAEARAIVTTGDIPLQDAVTGESRSAPYPEVGYHLFLAETQLLTGLPWATIFRFLPSVVFALTVLGAYIFGKRRGFGVEAALFASLLPTTVRFLGPA